MSVLPIEISTSDDVILRGQVAGEGDDWVILLHDVGLDLDTWQPLLPALLARGYRVASVDLRGHGASDGEWAPSKGQLDVEAILAYVQEQNPHRIFAAASGLACTPLLRAQSERPLDSVALLSPRPTDDEIASEDLRGPGIAKVFFVGAHDEPLRDRTVQLRNRSIGWSVIVNLPTTDNSTRLIWGRWRDHVTEHILSFFHEQRQDARGGSGPPLNASGSPQSPSA